MDLEKMYQDINDDNWFEQALKNYEEEYGPIPVNTYVGITYPSFPWFNFPKVFYLFWKKFCCKRNWHLFDESFDCDIHCLYCDACGLTVHIQK